MSEIAYYRVSTAVRRLRRSVARCSGRRRSPSPSNSSIRASAARCWPATDPALPRCSNTSARATGCTSPPLIGWARCFGHPGDGAGADGQEGRSGGAHARYDHVGCRTSGPRGAGADRRDGARDHPRAHRGRASPRQEVARRHRPDAPRQDEPRATAQGGPVEVIAWRITNGASLSDTAKQFGISAATVKRYLAFHRPAPDPGPPSPMGTKARSSCSPSPRSVPRSGTRLTVASPVPTLVDPSTTYRSTPVPRRW